MKGYLIVYTVTINKARAMTVFAGTETIIVTAIAIAMAHGYTPLRVWWWWQLSVQEGGLQKYHEKVEVTPPLLRR